MSWSARTSYGVRVDSDSDEELPTVVSPWRSVVMGPVESSRDAERIGRRRNVEDPPRRNIYGQLDNTSSISSEEDNDEAHGHEVCQICNDSTPATSPFLCVEGCGHRFCTTCMKRHAETGVRDCRKNGITCLHAGCPRTLTSAQLQHLLSTKSFELLTTRLTESAIPDHEKVYCPYKDCSTLFVKPADLHSSSPSTSARPLPSVAVGFVECENCHRGFCLECEVPWHGDQSCAEYKGDLNDKQFMSLARSKKWKRCEKCHYTVELAAGCHHMTCRCGHNFCYSCGSSWSDVHVCQSREERNTPTRQASSASNLQSPSRDPHRPRFIPSNHGHWFTVLAWEL